MFIEMDGTARVNDGEAVQASDEAVQATDEAAADSFEAPSENQPAQEEYQDLEEEAPAEEVPAERSPVSNQLSDIAEFGNRDLEASQSGIYQYTLTLSGIDNKEIRTAVKEALDDQRFNWDIDGVIAQIKAGSLVLSKLNPVKATVIVNRLKSLNIEIKWEQNDLIS